MVFIVKNNPCFKRFARKSAGNHGAIILGNIIGSNIANVGMVIGIAAILVPLAVSKSVLRKEIPIMLGVSFLLVLL